MNESSRSVYVLCGLLWAAGLAMPYTSTPMTLLPSLWLSVMVWGLVLVSTAPSGFVPGAHRSTVWASAGVLALLGALALFERHPMSGTVLLLGAGALVAGARDDEGRWIRVMLVSIVIAALVNAVVGALQVLVPQWTGGFWMGGRLGSPGRAAGYLRQPNQMATLLVIAQLALVALRPATARFAQASAALLAASAVLGAGVAFTGSRTGLVCLLVVLAWSWRSRVLDAPARRLMMASAVGLALGAVFMGVDGFVQRNVAAASDQGAGRLQVWANTVQMIREHPWTGVGWGNFSHVWALSPFPNRHPAAFDHAHNLVLQFLVELGIPLGLAVLGVLAWLWWRARHAAVRGVADARLMGVCLWMMLTVLGLHSLTEYPLWYPYFFLPAAFWMGLLISGATPSAVDAPAPETSPGAIYQALRGLGVVVMMSSMLLAWDYTRAVQAYAPFGAGLRQPLGVRIQEAQKSPMFGVFADYGAATLAERPEQVFDSFHRPLHYVINGNLLIAYARALHARGETEKARYVVQRIHEFRGDKVVADYLSSCDSAPEPKPFQCVPGAPSSLTYRDLD